MKIFNKYISKIQIDSNRITLQDNSNSNNEIMTILKNINLEEVSKGLVDLSNEKFYNNDRDEEIVDVSVVREYFINKKIPTVIVSIDVKYDNGDTDRKIDVWDDINGLYTDIINKIKEKNQTLLDLRTKRLLDEEREQYMV